MKKQLAAWLALGLITVLAGFSLSMTNEVTKEPILKQTLQDEARAKQEVLPEAESFEAIVLPEDSGVALFAGTADGETLGYVGKVTVTGYGGPIDVIAGVDENGVVKGVNVGGASFAETAGLGSKARDAAFTAQFMDKVSPVRVVKASDPKTESSVDAITAATITTNAVAGGVNRIARQVSDMLNPQETEVPVAEGTAYTASQQGFAGPVAVFVTVKDDGTISALKVGDAQFSETQGYGANALENDFTAQFVGKSLPLASGDIDGISGATITTNAVLAAINQAYEEKNIVAPAEPEGREYTAQAQGFAGPVAVKVIIGEDGTLSSLVVGDDQFAETEGYGAQALEPDFQKQFVGLSLPVSLDGIDAISGATITTEAVIDAVNAAFDQYMAEDTDISVVPEEITAPEGGEAEISIPQVFYTAEVQGYAGPVAVDVAFGEDGSIKQLNVGDARFEETTGLGSKAQETSFTEQFVGKAPPLALLGPDEEEAPSTIEAVTAATVTSQAVVDAINLAYDAYLQTSAAGEPETITISKQGYAGPVVVSVSFDANGRVASLLVGDEQFQETAGLGSKVRDEEFMSQFINILPPLNLREAEGAQGPSTIDGVTAATISSQAVVDAVNEAFETLGK